MFKVQKTTKVLASIGLLLMSRPSYSSDINTSFFRDFKPSDEAMLKGKMLPGSYFLHVSVNSKFLGVYTIDVRSTDEGMGIVLPAGLITSINPKKDFLSVLKRHKNIITNGNIQYVSFQYHSPNHSINLQIPDAYLNKVQVGTMAPAKAWDFGIPGFITKYNFSGSYNTYPNQSNANFYSFLYSQYNRAKWQFSSLFNTDLNTSSVGRAETSTINVTNALGTTIVPEIKSKFQAGYGQTSNSLGSVGFYGVSLFNEMQMLPSSLQSYKPEVKGTAIEATTVELYQNGKLIYKTHVSPGPYSITDYYPNVGGGNIEEVLTTASGKKTTTILPFGYIPDALTHGVYKYDVNVGYLENHHSLNPAFVDGELNYGLNDYFTPHIGAFLSKNYLLGSIGSSVNLVGWGGLNFQVGISDYHTSDWVGGNTGQHDTGWQGKLTYASSLNEIGTDIRLNAYLYQSKDFTSLANASSLNNYEFGHEKHQLNLSITQPLPHDYSVDLSTAYSTNWDNTSSLTGDINVTHIVSSRLSWSLQYSQSRYDSAQYDRSFNFYDRSFNFNVTFDFDGNQSITNSTHYNDTDKEMSNSSGYSFYDKENKYNGNLNMTVDEQASGENHQRSVKVTNLSGGLSWYGDKGRLGTSASVGQQQWSTSVEASGSVLYTKPTGLMLSGESGVGASALAIVNTNKLSGVAIDGESETDKEGFGVVDNLLPYNYDNINLSEGQNTDGRLMEHQATDVPVEGAILYNKFDSYLGKPLFIKLSSAYKNVKTVLDVDTNTVAEHVYGELYYFYAIQPGSVIKVFDNNNKLLLEKKLKSRLKRQEFID